MKQNLADKANKLWSSDMRSRLIKIEIGTGSQDWLHRSDDGPTRV